MPVSDHFADINKMVGLAKEAQRPVDDIASKPPVCYNVWIEIYISRKGESNVHARGSVDL